MKYLACVLVAAILVVSVCYREELRDQRDQMRAASQKRRYDRWMRRMRSKHVVFVRPSEDHRNWSDEYMRSLRK